MLYILHISDLHRSSAEPFNNDAVLAALLSDSTRYRLETPPIPRIDAIIVSGDIIQGLPIRDGAEDASLWKSELSEQYDVAYDFLCKLTDRYLGGDRSKIVIVPGNHDICWNTAFRSMAPVKSEEVKNGVFKVLSETGSLYRWSWSDLTTYKIVDPVAYSCRLDSYWTFVEKFYDGVELVRPIDRSAGYNLFEIADGRIIVAAFDSIAGNDCFSFSGDFAQDAVARCALELHDLNRVHDLRMAVWHHSIDGPPNRQDYMDVSRIHEMIGHGFRVGLHGHQHRAAAAAHYIHLPESQAMAVISAGSLCAGARELPRGVDRQYNVIALGDDLSSACLTVRQMTEGGHFARKNDGRFAADGSIDLSWERPLDHAGRPPDTDQLRLRQAIECAETLFAAGDPDGALNALNDVKFSPFTYQRSLALKLATASDKPERILSIIESPNNVDELVQFVMACIRTRRIELAEKSLSLPLASELSSALRNDIENRIETFRALNS
ncbi:metallophosphoesterase [Sphingobium sp. MK2]|uniref:metallophosphoesterase family protein n=1 Tax=Sphingobium sp. MK2 TaxID=3116540 RepID=UPI0032E359FC